MKHTAPKGDGAADATNQIQAHAPYTPSGDRPDEASRCVDRYPRLLLIDWTVIGGGAATGELKSVYFGDWPGSNFAHVYAGPPGRVGFSNGGTTEVFETSIDLLHRAEKFSPEAILYRPVADREDFHATAMFIIRSLSLPYAIWLMDDWPERLRVSDPRRYTALDLELRVLLKDSRQNFAISEWMAEAFAERYGVSFGVLRNGVRPEDWVNLPPPPSREEFLVRYAGSLAEDTTRESVELVAKAVEVLSTTRRVRFEIRTQRHWLQRERLRFEQYKATTISEALVGAAYRTWLSNADVLLIAYNFDSGTHRYLQYSFANKIPECMASGAPVLVVGPDNLSSVALLLQSNAVDHVSTSDVQAVKQALERLLDDPDRRKELGIRARQFAFTTFDLGTQQRLLLERIAAIAAWQPCPAPPNSLANNGNEREVGAVCCGRDDGVQLDEPRLLVQLLEADKIVGFMVDVGAHHGSSSLPFLQRGWRVLGFEPDPNNREKLISSVAAKFPKCEVVASAVGRSASGAVPIYASDESSGISGLSPFRSTHKEVARVPLVTLDDELSARVFEHIDLLKIDVEGHEMAVLQGLTFDRFRPRAVMVEYEDFKTREHGYDAHDLAAFLIEHGYTVFVSEWWPIVRYGARHSWRRLKAYPCEIPSEGWGNLIGFSATPSQPELVSALRKSLNHPNAPSASATVTAKVGTRFAAASSSGVTTPSIGAAAELGRDPIPATQSDEPTSTVNPWPFSTWCKGYLGRHAGFASVACLLFGALAAADLVRSGWWTVLAPLAVLFAGSMATLITIDYARFLFKKSRAHVATEIASVRAEMQSKLHASRIEEAQRTENLRAHTEAVRTEVLQALSKQHSEFSERVSRQQAALKRELGDRLVVIAATLDAHHTKAGSRIDAVSARLETVQTDMEKALADWQTKFRKETSQQHAALVDRLEQSLKQTTQRIDDDRVSDNAKFEALQRQSVGLISRFDDIAQSIANLRAESAGRLEQSRQAKAALDQVTDAVTTLRESTQALNNRFIRLNGSNAALVRPHPRFVESEELDRMVKHWAPALGLSVTERSLAYLAHQICLLEDRAVGRLATTISAALLRVLALRSLSGELLDVLEIGTLFGVGAGVLSRYGRGDDTRIRLTLIDPLDGYYGQGAADPQTGVHVTRLRLERNLREMGVDMQDYRILQAFSQESATVEEAASRDYDYILLDGDHSYEGVAKDFELYAPMVKPTGLLIFDDYDTTDWPAIKSFVDDRVRSHPDWEWIGGEWRTGIFRRKAPPPTQIQGTADRLQTLPAEKSSEL